MQTCQIQMFWFEIHIFSWYFSEIQMFWFEIHIFSWYFSEIQMFWLEIQIFSWCFSVIQMFSLEIQIFSWCFSEIQMSWLEIQIFFLREFVQDFPTKVLFQLTCSEFFPLDSDFFSDIHFVFVAGLSISNENFLILYWTSIIEAISNN